MGFKATIRLHTNYPGNNQAMFALTEQASNRSINLVTLSIGGDDLLLLQHAAYGADDRRAIRAGEMLAAIQRMKWEFEPTHQQTRHAVT
jgi:hypothetical protein